MQYRQESKLKENCENDSASTGLIRYYESPVSDASQEWEVLDEFELRLITATSGKVFVGDFIGEYQPGQLVLTAPKLAHMWQRTASTVKLPATTIKDKRLYFHGELITKATDLIPELLPVLPLLESASSGVEFYGISSEIEKLLDGIHLSTGLKRFALFADLLDKLAKHPNMRLLSTVPIKTRGNSAKQDRLAEIIDYIVEHSEKSLCMSDLAERSGMSESAFSRYFRKATGNTFTDFVNRIRINKASQLLLDTEQYISTICYSVGFNNVANFNRRFLEVRGMTPSDFRKNGKLRY